MLSIKSSKSLFLLIALLWVSTIAILTVQPHAVALWLLRSTDNFPFAHMGAYGFLCFVLCFYFRFNRQSLFRASLFALLTVLVVGSLAEGVQMFVADRTADILDIRDNMIGGFVAAAIFIVMAKTGFLRKSVPVQLELFVLPRAIKK